jgi:hypothetical protein
MEEQNDGEKTLMGEIEDLMGKEAAERIKEIKHGDSVLTGGKAGYESVMKILAKAVASPDKDYRQALLLSTFLDRDDATQVVAALDERQRYGVDITPVVNLITAWSAVQGARGGRIDSLIEGQTHQSITTNMPSSVKNFLKNKKKNEPLG